MSTSAAWRWKDFPGRDDGGERAGAALDGGGDIVGRDGYASLKGLRLFQHSAARTAASLNGAGSWSRRQVAI